MKSNIVTYKEPRTRQKALNLAAYMCKQIDNWGKRRENLMSNIEATKKKIAKLEETLSQYFLQLEKIDTSKEDWNKKLKDLQDMHQLLEAEILETKSSLLRQQISELKKQAGVSDAGTKDLF